MGLFESIAQQEYYERMERERGILRDAVVRAIYAKGLPEDTEKMLRAALEACGVF